MAKALFLSPMVPSFDLELSRRFFCEGLGFRTTIDTDTYKVIERDGLTLHLLAAGDDIGQMEFYLEVDDIDAVWDGLQSQMDGVKSRDPFDRDYGMREAHVEVPATRALLFIGQRLS